MSDAAFPTAAYPGHTNRELLALIDAGSQYADRMRAELARRAAVAAGDMTNATPGERLRAARYDLVPGTDAWKRNAAQVEANCGHDPHA